MTSPRDTQPAPESPLFSSTPSRLALPLDEDAGPVSLYQEINERRARLENAELLQNLRGL
jgi:hypothetical protein